jgi:hypothetical protein
MEERHAGKILTGFLGDRIRTLKAIIWLFVE